MHAIAIAGAWGYIGRRFADAALELGLRTAVYDPGPPPPDAPLDRVTRFTDEEAFYRLPADLFHLALHPEHRGRALEILLGRARCEPILILNEKPMAHPERPQDCQALIDAVAAAGAAAAATASFAGAAAATASFAGAAAATASFAGAAMLFDFPELFDPLTLRLLEFLGQFRQVDIHRIHVQRSKDREARDNPRNRKRMVHIQYQESVHCIAFALHLLAHCRGSAEAVLEQGAAARATSAPYDPPNPEEYPYVVDGRCEYELEMGGTALRGCTDFKRGARWEKSRLIRGVGDGRTFTIEADYLEGAKYLRLDGVDQGLDPQGSSCTAVLTTLARWAAAAGPAALATGLYPNPAFTRLTYQLSSLVWRSCYEGRGLRLPSLAGLIAFDAGFAAAARRFPRYPLA